MPLQSDLVLNFSKLRKAAVDPKTVAFNEYLEEISSNGPKWYEVGASKYREMRSNGETVFPAPTVLPQGKDTSIPSRESGRGIPCRVMLPENKEPVKGVYMHIHGGGWVLSSEKEVDILLQWIANAGQLAVVSIGYRLAPENPFPKPMEDCYDAADWLVDNAEKEYRAPFTFMGGESAGGHLSVLSCFHLLSSRPHHALRGLVLNFGAYSLSFLPQAVHFNRNLILNYSHMSAFREALLPGWTPLQWKDPAVSPFFQDLTDMKLPPALFTCGTEDALLDDTMMMAVKWMMNGNEAIVKLYEGAPHGFIVFPGDKMPPSVECRKDIETFMKEKLTA